MPSIRSLGRFSLLINGKSRLLRALHSRNRQRYSHSARSGCMLISLCPSNARIVLHTSMPSIRALGEILVSHKRKKPIAPCSALPQSSAVFAFRPMGLHAHIALPVQCPDRTACKHAVYPGAGETLASHKRKKPIAPCFALPQSSAVFAFRPMGLHAHIALPVQCPDRTACKHAIYPVAGRAFSEFILQKL